MNQPTDQPILVLSRKKPHLIFFMVLVVLSGLAYFVEGPVENEIPDWLGRTWAGFLLWSGSVALIAHLQRWDRERGMHVERGALTIQSAAVLAYGACLPQYLGWTPGTFISILAALAWAAANFAEVHLIGSDLKLISAMRRLTLPRSDNAADR